MRCNICGHPLTPGEKRCACCGTVLKKEEKKHKITLRCASIALAAALFFLPGCVSRRADGVTLNSMSLFRLLQSLLPGKFPLLFALGAMLLLLAAIFYICKKKDRKAAALLSLYGVFLILLLFIGGYRLQLTPSYLCLAEFISLASGSFAGSFDQTHL